MIEIHMTGNRIRIRGHSGYAPRSSNHVTFNTDFYGRSVSGPAYPWCCTFVWDKR